MDENQIEKIDLNKIDWRGSREFFESLGEALDKLDDKDEKYDFTWVGKRKAIIEAGAPINKTFRPDVEASKNWDTTENLFIEGDNLDALKLLQESYLGKVKMIYIDPPYNTGKDFVYHDNFKANVEEYDEATEYKDEAGNIQFKKNEKSNGRYHSDWLSMMYPRLKLARNILTDDGVIFISIGKDEHTNLTKLCDEIFGEENKITSIVWKSKSGGSADETHIVNELEYILVYARRLDSVRLNQELVDAEKYKNRDDYYSDRGAYILKKMDFRMTASHYTETLNYSVVDPDGNELWPGGGKYRQDGGWNWRWGKAKMKWGFDQGFLEFRQSKNGWVLNSKQYLSVDNDGKKINRSNPYRNFINSSDYSTSTGSRYIVDLFGSKVFEYPKPHQLIQSLVKIGTDTESIILDFFSGSATTAHAVIQQNAEDAGTRKWIMVQLPEVALANSEAYKAGYKTIPEIARERIRRAGDKIASEHPEAKVDYGFRSLTIDDTNYKEVYRAAGELQQSTLLNVVDNVKEDRSDIDLLYGVLTQSALELNRPIEKREISGSDVYLYDYFGDVSGLVGCFSEQVSEETVKEIARLKPLTAVFRDSSFTDSQAKVNLSEHFRVLSPETKVKVI